MMMTMKNNYVQIQAHVYYLTWVNVSPAIFCILQTNKINDDIEFFEYSFNDNDFLSLLHSIGLFNMIGIDSQARILNP